MSYVNGISTLINPIFISSGKVLSGEADCKDVDIRGKYLIIKTDHEEFKGKILDNFFKPGMVRCISDYVIVSDELVLVCEMKSNNEGKMKVQLKNTGRITKYILSMIKEHHNITAEIPQIKYVCFANAYKGQKQRTNSSKLDRIPWIEGSELFKLPCNSIYHLSQFR